jgi:hypothetical protein
MKYLKISCLGLKEKKFDNKFCKGSCEEFKVHRFCVEKKNLSTSHPRLKKNILTNVI